MSTTTPILVSSVLDRLLDDDPRAGDPSVDPLDFRDVAKFIERLMRPDDQLSAYILSHFVPEGRAALVNADLHAPIQQSVIMVLTDGLNAVIRGPLLYEPRRFEGKRLTADMIRVMEENRTATQTATLNRILLDEVFSQELHRMRRPSQPGVSIREIKASISRDLESLLNTRRELLLGVEPEFKEIGNSLLMLGLPDFTSYGLLNAGHRRSICRAIEEAVEKFEPRLRSIRVTLETTETLVPTLHFRIDAVLRVEPLSQPVTFDASLQMGTNSYQIAGETS